MLPIISRHLLITCVSNACTTFYCVYISYCFFSIISLLSPAKSRDVTALCRDVITILRHNATGKHRVTALKVLEACQGRGARVHRAPGVKATTLPRHDLERLLVHLLLEGYVREDFHFTAYSTISYLLPGRRAHLLDTPGHSVTLAFPAGSQKAIKAIDSPASRDSDCSLVSATAGLNGERDCSFVSATAGLNGDRDCSLVSADGDRRNLKRKAIVIESDSEQSDFS